MRVGWEAINAVKNGMIFPINEDWVSRGGPRIIDGLEAIHSKVQDVILINSPEDQIWTTRIFVSHRYLHNGHASPNLALKL